MIGLAAVQPATTRAHTKIRGVMRFMSVSGRVPACQGAAGVAAGASASVLPGQVRKHWSRTSAHESMHCRTAGIAKTPSP
jgi:hypothetical protein